MTIKTPHKAPIIALQYKHRQGKVIVEPEDESRFMVSVDAAIKACQAWDRQEQFRRQLTYLQSLLGRWIYERRKKISQAFLTLEEAGLLLLVVRKTRPFDGAFEDELSALDIQVAQDPQLELVRMDVLALPQTSAENIGSFLAPEMTLEFHHAR